MAKQPWWQVTKVRRTTPWVGLASVIFAASLWVSLFRYEMHPVEAGIRWFVTLFATGAAVYLLAAWVVRGRREHR